jgi:hypothetical protein
MLECAAQEAFKTKGVDLETKTVAEQLIIALMAKAASGDVPACKEILDSAFGKIADKTELTGKDGEEFKGLTVTFVKPEGK